MMEDWKTPTHSNRSSSRAGLGAGIGQVVSKDSDEQETANSGGPVVLDAKLEKLFSSIVLNLFKKGNTTKSLDDLKTAVQNRRTTCLLGTTKPDQKEKVLTHLFAETNGGKQTVLLRLLQKKKAALGRQEDLSPADTKLREVLTWVTAAAKIDCQDNQKRQDMITELQGVLILLLVAVVKVLLDNQLPTEPGELLAAQKEFVAYLMQAVLRDEKSKDAYKAVVLEDDLELSEEEQDHYETVQGVDEFKTAVKQLLVRKILGVGAIFDGLVVEFDTENRFKRLKLDSSVHEKIRNSATIHFVPNENWLFTPTGASSQPASLNVCLKFLVYGVKPSSVVPTPPAAISATATAAPNNATALAPTTATASGNAMAVAHPITSAVDSGSLINEEFLLELLKSLIVDSSIGNQLRVAALVQQRFPNHGIWALIEKQCGPDFSLERRQDHAQSGSVSPFMSAATLSGASSAHSSGESNASAYNVADDGDTEMPEKGDVFVLKNFLKNKVLWQLLQLSDPKDRSKALAEALLGGFEGTPQTTLEKAAAGLLCTEQDFHIVKFLGKGSVAAVFEAIHKLHLNIRLALKMQVVRKDQFAKSFLRQFMLQFSLHEKYVVQLLGWHLCEYSKLAKDLPELPDELVVAMLMELGDYTLEDFRVKQVAEMRESLLKGKSTKADTQNATKYDNLLKINLPILQYLLEGLEHCHDLGVIHRDFKTENILSVKGTWKISDFGTAKENHPCVIKATKDQGTEGYQPPEAKKSIYTDKTDIYSFGRVLYEMVAGQLPKGGCSKWYNKDVFRLSKVGGQLAKLLQALMAQNADDRPNAKSALVEIKAIIAILNTEG